MLLTITTTHQPATDLGYLLHKNPARVQTVNLSFGKAHVFYPEATAEKCTAAMLIDVDPVGLVRKKSEQAFALQQYVNDRPYAASSFLSVALAQVFGTAMGGRSKDRQELAEMPIPLSVRIPVLPCRGGETVLKKLFEPLGYALKAERLTLDEKFPEWGDSRYFDVELSAVCRLQDVLNHLYVLVPVLDDEKHYWVDTGELEKLLRKGDGWLAAHPEKELITKRYLKHRAALANEALSRFMPEETTVAEDEAEHDAEENEVEKKLRLNDVRMATVFEKVKSTGAARVLDLGCGEGKLLKMLLGDKQFTEILGMDVSYRTLEIAAKRLKLEALPDKQRERIQLLHSSLVYRDRRLEGYDAATIIEVIEHLDEERLTALERNVFGFARPNYVIITTPNAEYNALFETLPAGKFRHKDHRFEWTRGQFEEWAQRVCAEFGYSAEFFPVGDVDEKAGSPTQMAVFKKGEKI
ncbi:MAG TPA: 3' terminal RNA ribose 2'-O-methyltransferase Hen1 [Patescibacteria group bacterium]|nr:3' terminal RNA ribose 2'-O-methyltransferase Hen1 [Patescibacteria group bacterium]